MFFSPDGKYLAFDLPSGDRVGDTRDVFLMAVDGSRESPVAASPAREIMMGWSPDGKRLLFSSDRNGANGLWAQRIEDGKALGVPELLKSEIGHRSLGVTAAGSLFVGVNVGDLDIHLASVDFETGKISGTASRPVQTYVGSNRGWSWSPDGRSAVYVSQRDPIPGRRSAVIVRALETGTVRELIPQLGGFSDSIVWAPDGRSFVTAGADLKGRRGLYRIDAQTADTTTVVVSEPGTSFFSPQFSADGQRLYYAISKRGDVTFVERDLSSGSQRDVIRRTSLSSIVLSPDGRFIATTQDPNQQSAAVLLIPVGGGEPRELMRVTEPRFIQGVEGWAPDSRELIVSVAKTDAEEKDILLVSIDDGRFRPLEVPPGFRSGPIHVRPDGQQISYVAGKNAQEVWVLENFLPK
jgi:Tol biopolymer transport system component